MAKKDEAATAKPHAKGQKGDAKGGKAEAKPAKVKAAKAAAPAEAPAPAPVKVEAPPRPAPDLRLKVLKKFYGKFLPRGVLRDRHKAIMDRWNSGDEHGGVTLEELKKLLDDWRGTQEKPPRLPKA